MRLRHGKRHYLLQRRGLSVFPNFASIAKWAVVAAFIAMSVTVFNAFEAKGKLQSSLKSQEAQLKRSNEQIANANSNIELLMKTNKEQSDEFKRKTEASNKYKRRALYAERELSKIVSDGDIDAINYSLCQAYDRIEGNDADSRKERCNDNTTPGTSSSLYFKISQESLQNLLANNERIASTIDQCFIK